MLRHLFLVPARSGSKGIPKKNIAPVAGKPLIAWTLEAALGSRYQGKLVVTTESEEIANIARAHGAEVPFLRPSALASDTASSIDTAVHALRWLEANEGYWPDYLVLLQPTSPLRKSEDIDCAIELAADKNALAVVSVSEASCHPYWAKKIGSEGTMVDFIPLQKPVDRRQELSEAFGLNGAIFIIKPDVLIEKNTWYPDPTYPFIMPIERSLDVDAPWDLYLADLILSDMAKQH